MSADCLTALLTWCCPSLCPPWSRNFFEAESIGAYLTRLCTWCLSPPPSAYSTAWYVAGTQVLSRYLSEGVFLFPVPSLEDSGSHIEHIQKVLV